MAYISSNLYLLSSSPSGVQQWQYLTTDAFSTVTGAGYFNDGALRNMWPGDGITIIVYSTALPAGEFTGFLSINFGEVSSISGYAATVSPVTVSASELPTPTGSTLGGVLSASAGANQFMTGINTSGAPTFGYPLGSTVANVMLYGATGDGTTDDTAAINAAITAAGSGGTVYFPNGTYIIGAAGLTLSASVKFLGASQDGAILKLGATGTTLVSPANGSPSSATVFINVTAGSVEFENITVNANSKAYFSLYFATGINNITLRNSIIEGGTYGLYLQNNSNVFVNGCSFILNALHQAFYSSTATASGVTFLGCYFDPQGANASAATASVDLWFQAMLSGVLTEVVVSGNVFNYAGLGAVETDGLVVTTSGASSAMSLVSITGNTITTNTGTSSSGNGIEVSGPSLVDISGNTISVAGQVGIVLEVQGTTIPTTGSVTGNVVTGTNPSGNATYGILITSGSWNVSGNYVKGFEYCIGISSTGAQNIIGNTLEQSTAGGPGGTQGGLNYTANSGKTVTIANNLFYAPSVSFVGISVSTTTTLTNLTISGNAFYNMSYGVYFWASPTCSNTSLLFNKFLTVSVPYSNVPTSGCLQLDATSNALQINAGAILSSPAAATLQLGAADAASPVAQTLGMQNVLSTTANTAGAAAQINGSAGTGSSAGGALSLAGASAGGASLAATTVTASNGSPALVLTTSGSHGLAQLQQVVLSGTTAPGGTTLGTIYFVTKGVNFATTTVSLSTTLANAIAGTAIAYSSAGSAVKMASVQNSQFPALAVVPSAAILGSGATAQVQPPSVVVGGTVPNTLATTATDGFFYIPSCAGTPTGTPTAFTGKAPLVIDSTNNTLSYYNSGWKPIPTAVAVMPGGRLTLATATPVMMATVSGATTVYYTPYKGRAVPLYNGTTFITTDTGGELSQATTDTTKSPAAVAASSVYDIFVWNDAGTIRATRGPAWTNTTTRSAGTALTLLNGILVNNAAITNGPAQYYGTYVGTIASNASSTIDWILGTAASGGGAASLMVWNYYNRVMLATRVTDNGTAYTYTTATIRQARGSTTNQINYLAGMAEDCITAAYQTGVTLVAAVGAFGEIGVGDDSITAFETTPGQVYSNVAVAMTGRADTIYQKGMGEPMLGVHYVAALEVGDGTNANTFNVGTQGELSFTFMM
jgi:Pectate lyase superfamily protein